MEEIEEETEERQGPDFERIGLFKEMSYLGGEIPHFEFIDSSKGKQMVVQCTKSKAGTQDGYFDKTFPRVFEGEGYADPIRARRLYRLAQAKLNRDGVFKYTSPTKTPCGKGTYYGTFIEYGEGLEYFSSKPRDPGTVSPPKRNIFTNPPKKGSGSGYPDVTINKFPPYFLDEQLEEYEESEKGPPPRPQPRPFKPYKAGIYQQEFFDRNPYGSTVEEPEEEEKKRKGPKKHEEKKEIKPFVPNGPAKKDGGMKDGCLSKFPEYVEDLYPTFRDDMRGAKHYVNSQNEFYRASVPGCNKPYPVKSIIAKNVERKVTPLNSHKVKEVFFCKPCKKSEVYKKSTKTS